MLTHWIKTKEGKEYAVRFSNGVVMQLAVVENIHANEIQKFLSDFAKWPLGRVYRFYHLMFKYGASKENREFDLSEDDFIMLLGEDETVLPQILKVVSASQPEPAKKK